MTRLSTSNRANPRSLTVGESHAPSKWLRVISSVAPPLVFLSSRLFRLSLTVLVVASIVFVLLRLSGDPVRSILPLEADVRYVEVLRKELGLDKPLYVQYGRFIWRSIQGNFGVSFVYRQPASRIIRERMLASLKLVAGGVAVMLVVSIPLGIIAAMHRGSLVDTLAMGLAVLGQSMPAMWLGIMLILIFSVNFGWLPTAGGQTPAALVLPSVTLGVFSAGILTRLMRSSLLEVLSMEYIRTARAKGLRENDVVLKHALKNAAIPVVTMIGYQVPLLFSSAIITETVFSYPGMGRLLMQAVGYRDIPVVVGVVIVVSVMVVACNLAVDILYTWLDPRVRVK